MRIPRPILYIGGALAAVVLLIIIASAWWSSMQISKSEADTVCADFADEVIADIRTIPEYTVAGSAKKCEAIEDELSFQDYRLTVNVRVNADALDSETAFDASMEKLADILPDRNYPIDIVNIAPKGSKPGALCVTADRYIDNDGKDVLQGPVTHSYRYTDPADIDMRSPCDNI
jgi:hypothetical protein